MSLPDVISFSFQIIIIILLFWLAVSLCLAYYYDARSVAQANIERADILRRRAPELREKVARVEQRLNGLADTNAQPAQPEIREARDHIYEAQASLAIIEQIGIPFLPRYTSNRHALKTFLLRPNRWVQLAVVDHGLARQTEALQTAQTALDAAWLTVDRLENVHRQLRRAWRDMSRRWQFLIPLIQEESNYLPDCVDDYRTRALEVQKGLKRVRSELDRNRPVEERLKEDFVQLEEKLQTLEHDFNNFLSDYRNYLERFNTLKNVLNRGEFTGGSARVVPPLLLDAIQVILEQARMRTEVCDFSAAVDWLAVAEGWLELVPAILDGVQGVQELLKVRDLTLRPERVAILLSRWEVVFETVKDRWVEIAGGVVREPEQAASRDFGDELEKWLTDLSWFQQHYEDERLQTKEHADAVLRQYAQTMVWIRDNGGLDRTLRQSINGMRRAWARAAENPRLLTELADETARKSQVLGRQFALDRSRHRKFQQIMTEVRPLLEAARKHGQEWACLRAEAGRLEGITGQIGQLHSQMEANGGDGRHQKLEQIVKLSEQARTLGQRVTAAARDLALQKKRIRRKVAHVEEHFLLLNPAYVRSQLDYVSDQVAFAQEMSDLELAREELRRTLNLIDDIVVHGGGGQDGKTGY